jgi:hypothetical protein
MATEELLQLLQRVIGKHCRTLILADVEGSFGALTTSFDGFFCGCAIAQLLF